MIGDVLWNYAALRKYCHRGNSIVVPIHRRYSAVELICVGGLSRAPAGACKAVL